MIRSVKFVLVSLVFCFSALDVSYASPTTCNGSEPEHGALYVLDTETYKNPCWKKKTQGTTLGSDQKIAVLVKRNRAGALAIRKSVKTDQDPEPANTVELYNNKKGSAQTGCARPRKKHERKHHVSISGFYKFHALHPHVKAHPSYPKIAKFHEGYSRPNPTDGCGRTNRHRRQFLIFDTDYKVLQTQIIDKGIKSANLLEVEKILVDNAKKHDRLQVELRHYKIPKNKKHDFIKIDLPKLARNKSKKRKYTISINDLNERITYNNDGRIDKYSSTCSRLALERTDSWGCPRFESIEREIPAQRRLQDGTIEPPLVALRSRRLQTARQNRVGRTGNNFANRLITPQKSARVKRRRARTHKRRDHTKAVALRTLRIRNRLSNDR